LVYAQLSSEPTLQASAIVIYDDNGGSLSLSFTSGNGSYKLIVARAGSPVNSNPVDGTTYSASSIFGIGSQIGSGNFVMDGSSSMTGFTVGVTYHFRIYEYNKTAAAGSANYNVTTATGNPVSFLRTEPEPSTQSSNISFTNIGATSLTINFSKGNGTSRIVVAKAGSSVDSNPVDGVAYTANNNFGGGSQIGSGNFVVGSGNSPITITGLSLGTNYYFRIFEFNGSVSAYLNYKLSTASNNPKNIILTEPEPTIQSKNIDFLQGPTSLTVYIGNNGNGNSRLLVARANSAVNADPVDGTSHTASSVFGSGSQIGTGNYVVGMGLGPFTVMGLSQSVVYYFKVYEFNGSGTSVNYLTSNSTNNPNSISTLANEPSSAPTNLRFSNLGSYSNTVSFTAAVGSPTGYIILRTEPEYFNTSEDYLQPYDGIKYQIGDAFFDGSSGDPLAYVAYVGNGVSFDDVFTYLPESRYYYFVYSFNGSVSDINYLNLRLTGTRRSLSQEPGSNPSNFTGSSISENEISLSFSPASSIPAADGYVIFKNEGAAVPVVSNEILDGKSPTEFVLPAGVELVKTTNSSETSFVDSGLITGTLYNYLIIPFNGESVPYSNFNHTHNYKVDGTLKTASVTPAYSSSSSIIIDASFSYPNNILYSLYQTASNLTSANSVEVAKFTLKDGGGVSDADGGSTLLNAISFSATNASLIRRVALYDGIDWLAETAPSGSTFSFTGLNIVASDNGSKAFSLRVSFNTTVTDNQQFSFTVTSATAALSGSGFASSNASGAATSTAGDNNRLEVTATKITYTTQPPSLIGVNTNVSPIPVLEARDVLNNKDLDYSSTVTLSNSASLTMANGSTAFSSGALTFPTNFQFTSYGTSTLTVASGTLTSATSGTIVVRAAEPVAQPTGLTFNTITANTMNGSFTAATGSPAGYLVVRKEVSAPIGLPADGSTYSVGDPTADGTVVHSGATTSFSDAGLIAGTVYHYAVYSYNGSGQAINYLTTSPILGNEITRPPPPTVEEAANVIPGSFKTKWSAAKSATSYQLFVAKDQGFASPLTNYNPKTVSILEEQLSGLETSQTSYWYKVKAVNASGTSDDSNVVTVITPGAGGVSLLSFSSSSNNGVKVSATLAGGTGTRLITLHYRKIVSASFSDELLSAAGDTYEKDITTDLMDELGIEYYFSATDASVSNPIETAHGFIYKTFNETGSTIPFSSRLDGTTTTYEMFSVPYKLDKSDVPSVFKQEYDKTKWRLFHYQNEKTIENLNGFNSIELGKGYWFNAKGKFDVSPGAGKVAETNQSKDFIVTLAAGWNQIGNPYPFNVDWNQIKDANPAAGLNALYLFENGYGKKDVLAPWKGAFVFSDNGGTVNFPVLAKTASPGRRQENELKPVLDEAAWQFPVILQAGDITQVSGVGMHPEAKTSKDRFDEITIPRFIDYLEMNTYHNEFFAPYFATDIVPTSDSYSWEFTLSSNLGSRSASLSWDQQSLNLSQSKIALLDLHNGVLIDMKSRGEYEFAWQEGMQFKILYSRTGDLLPGVTALGQSYPNPFTKNVVIPVLLESNQQEAEVSVYDLLGRKVKSIGLRNVKAGIHEVEWDGNNEQGVSVEGGMYFYQLRGTKGAMSPAKRMIKQ